MLAALGLTEVAVTRQARVSIVATGDETVPPGAPLAPGGIYDCNSALLRTLAQEASARVVSCAASIPDTRDATRRALEAGLADCDVLVVSGGVSMGAHDHVRPALTDLGVEEQFWQLALRPGHPTWFGRHGEQLVFGLPGNPVSAYVTFLLLVRPVLDRLHGRRRPRPMLHATYRGAEVASPAGTTTALRCRLEDAPGPAKSGWGRAR